MIISQNIIKCMVLQLNKLESPSPVMLWAKLRWNRPNGSWGEEMWNVKSLQLRGRYVKCEKFTTTDYGQISLRKARLSLQPRWAKSKTLDCPMNDKRFTKRDQLELTYSVTILIIRVCWGGGDKMEMESAHNFLFPSRKFYS